MFEVAKCGHCGKSGTKAIMIEPADARYKQTAICCASCNAILGVTGFYDEGQLLKDAEARANALAQKVNHIEHQLAQLSYDIQSLKR